MTEHQSTAEQSLSLGESQRATSGAMPQPAISARPQHGVGRWYRPSAGDLQLLGIWLTMRVLLGVYLGLVAPLSPQTAIERTIALWPPSAPLRTWLVRVLLAPWDRQDVTFYKWIAERGYNVADGTAQFHPLFPWLASPLTWISSQPLIGLLVVSSLASALLLLAFERLARMDLAPEAARTSTLLLLSAPPAFILFAPYSESLFLLCAVLCLLWARRRSWWLAGLAGALAVLTRQQGIFLALPLAWELWEASGRNVGRALRSWRCWLALGLIPAGLLLWLVYRALALSDLQANFSHPQALIYSLLISPSASKVVPHQAFLWPWQSLWLALRIYISGPAIYRLIDLVLGAGFIVLLAAAWQHMRASYRIYVVAIVLVSFAYHTGPHFPYMGLPRHLLLAFPVFIGLGPVFRDRLPRLLMVTGGLLAMLFLLLQFAISAWIP